jgi:hypothetical protein
MGAIKQAAGSAKETKQPVWNHKRKIVGVTLINWKPSKHAKGKRRK